MVITNGLPGNGDKSSFFADLDTQNIGSNSAGEAILGSMAQVGVTVVIPDTYTFAEGTEYTVNGYTVTVTYSKPCKLGYYDQALGKYVALEAQKAEGEDNKYSFTVTDPSVREVVLVIKGDADLNRRVNTADVSQAQRFVLTKDDPTAMQVSASDVTSDGRMNTADVSVLQRTILGKDNMTW